MWVPVLLLVLRGLGPVWRQVSAWWVLPVRLLVCRRWLRVRACLVWGRRRCRLPGLLRWACRLCLVCVCPGARRPCRATIPLVVFPACRRVPAVCRGVGSRVLVGVMWMAWLAGTVLRGRTVRLVIRFLRRRCRLMVAVWLPMGPRSAWRACRVWLPVWVVPMRSVRCCMVLAPVCLACLLRVQGPLACPVVLACPVCRWFRAWVRALPVAVWACRVLLGVRLVLVPRRCVVRRAWLLVFLRAVGRRFPVRRVRVVLRLA